MTEEAKTANWLHYKKRHFDDGYFYDTELVFSMTGIGGSYKTFVDKSLRGEESHAVEDGRGGVTNYISQETYDAFKVRNKE